MAIVGEILKRRAMENDIKAMRRKIIEIAAANADLAVRVAALEADADHKADCRARLTLIRQRRPGKVAP